MIDNQKPEGYYIPIHKSAVDPILIGGINRNLCLGLWSCGIAIGVMMRMYWFFIIVIAIHLFVLNATKKDPEFFATVLNHIHDRHFFDV